MTISQKSAFHNTLHTTKPQVDFRLFCLPYAGASSLIFRTWSKHLPANIEVRPIELPGRGTKIKSPSLCKLESLVETIVNDIIPYLDKPFAFFGHSMGGLISFEVTRLLLRKYNQSPTHLFISARRAPQIIHPYPPIHNLPDAEFIEKLRLLQGTPESILGNSELMEMVLPILRADFEILETYVYKQEAILNCPITVFGGLKDEEATLNEIEAWKEMTNAEFSLIAFPEDHFFIHSSQENLLKNISDILTKVSA
jgi:medium-chain acyl-[acyl-carrier-protein] hydrolase